MLTQTELLALIRGCANTNGVDEDLAVSIAMVESSCAYPRSSTRFEPGWKYLYKPEEFALINGISVDTEKVEQSTSWGPMHIMGSVCREMGFKDPLPLLFNPITSIDYAIKKIKFLSSTFENEDKVIASYNGGPGVKIVNGQYPNQKYVDKVKFNVKKLRVIS